MPKPVLTVWFRGFQEKKVNKASRVVYWAAYSNSRYLGQLEKLGSLELSAQISEQQNKPL